MKDGMKGNKIAYNVAGVMGKEKDEKKRTF